MCVCVRVRVCACVFVRMYVRTYVCLTVCLFACLPVCLSVRCYLQKSEWRGARGARRAAAAVVVEIAKSCQQRIALPSPTPGEHYTKRTHSTILREHILRSPLPYAR